MTRLLQVRLFNLIQKGLKKTYAAQLTCTCRCCCDPEEGYFRSTQGTAIRFYQTESDDKEKLTSETKPSVLKSWVKSIVGNSTGTELEESPKEVIKRPPKQSSEYSLLRQSNSISKAKLRRRLSDNMWTNEAMDDKIIWVDCEMTGLNPDKDKLMEIGMIITNANLQVLAQQDSVVFHVDEPVLQGMDVWCQKHHGGSGLTEAARKSTITLESADEMLLKFVQAHTTPGECPMAGNSIGQDRMMFIMRQLPKFYAHFHYRSINVSTVKELVHRWYPAVTERAPRKKYSHRVLDDIIDSIEELSFYRSTVFAPPGDTKARVLDENARVAKRT